MEQGGRKLPAGARSEKGKEPEEANDGVGTGGEETFCLLGGRDGGSVQTGNGRERRTWERKQGDFKMKKWRRAGDTRKED